MNSKFLFQNIRIINDIVFDIFKKFNARNITVKKKILEVIFPLDMTLFEKYF
jgi:hypothetical protein